jgi:Fe-Mn family superoxide dismutase
VQVNPIFTAILGLAGLDFFIFTLSFVKSILKMKKRTFLKTGLAIGAGMALSPVVKAYNRVAPETIVPIKGLTGTTFELPPLPYETDALEPMIDTRTMEIHYGKHHAGYVKKLNAALEGSTMKGMVIEDILREVTDKASESGIRNNAGGHYNHTLFWQIMAPGGKALDEKSKLAKAIKKQFGSYEAFEKEFKDAAKTVFGSGWAWLCAGKGKKLFISQTPNQDNPVMKNLVDQPGVPLLGIDVWEHAYYLKHQNLRGDYIDSFMQVINWEMVEKRFSAV